MDALALAAAISVLFTVVVLGLALSSGAAVGVQVRSRLEGVLAGRAASIESGVSAPLRQSRTVIGFLRHIVSGSALERMAEDLQRAGSQLQPLDFISLRIVLAGLGFVIPYLFYGGVVGMFIAAVAAVLGFQAPQVWMTRRREAKRKKLEEQLPETLTLVSNSLKAGFGLLQALNLAADQLEPPISTELAQTIHEMNVGSSAEEALLGLSGRAGSYDLDLVVTAILIQRSVGGNLAEILDTVAETMRERVRIRGEINTLTAQQRMTGVVIGLLPLGVGGLLLVVSPGYITPLFTETVGKLMVSVAVVLEGVGIMIIRRILDIEV